MTHGRLVTEREVQRAAHGNKRIQLAPNAIVTPAARDLARALGVTLDPDSARPESPPSTPGRVVAVGADHGGTALRDSLLPVIADSGFRPEDLGSHGTESVDYPVYAARVAEMVAAGEAVFGVMVDGAGIGSAMVANKIPGVRAAMCYDVTTAHNAREHNNANVLTLGGSLLGPRLAAEIVRTFLTTPFGGGRHARRVAMIDALLAPAQPPSPS